MTENKKLSDEELEQVIKALKQQIIKNTKDHIVMCKICGLEYKKSNQPLIKTDDGYICRKCRNKQRIYNRFYK